ncbi:MAG: replicative DNA helicase, partial [Rhodospirillales bacterium]|nr:replicative DNA helicase [Rhodospirillales bacterium]
MTLESLYVAARGNGFGEDAGVGREPPINLEAEQALLSVLLANNLALERVGDFLRAEHFADAAHQRIFEACHRLIDRGQVANAITLKNYFERDEGLADVGGSAYLGRLTAVSGGIINVVDYARLIHDLFLRRQLIELGEEMVNEAHSHELDKDAQNQIEVCEKKLYDLAETGSVGRDFTPFSDALTLSITMAETAMRHKGVSGVSSGFTDLDRVLGGLHDSDLVILAARPSMGKTSLATNIASNVATAKRERRQSDGSAVGERQVVAFFSLEMSSEQLATRVVSDMANVSSDRIRRGDISKGEFNRVFEAARHLGSLPLFIDDMPAITVPALRTRARRLKRQQKGLSLIVVDYLQLMQGVGGRSSENRVQEISEITRGLKAIAKDLSVPVIALSQLSRATEQRDDKRPQLSDLRESGSIEQDADVVFFLFREEYYLARKKPSKRANEEEETFKQREKAHNEEVAKVKNIAEVIVAKQRHGPIDTVELHFNGE